ncbi:hypothetical protein BJ742DRAFT_871911 [Cladochytrium replicatum]|nr:hypothetical protein BJ742DRAFT_871911 [Cladochytrium replicatum]
MGRNCYNRCPLPWLWVCLSAALSSVSPRRNQYRSWTSLCLYLRTHHGNLESARHLKARHMTCVARGAPSDLQCMSTLSRDSKPFGSSGATLIAHFDPNRQSGSKLSRSYGQTNSAAESCNASAHQEDPPTLQQRNHFQLQTETRFHELIKNIKSILSRSVLIDDPWPLYHQLRSFIDPPFHFLQSLTQPQLIQLMKSLRHTFIQSVDTLGWLLLNDAKDAGVLIPVELYHSMLRLALWRRKVTIDGAMRLMHRLQQFHSDVYYPEEQYQFPDLSALLIIVDAASYRREPQDLMDGLYRSIIHLGRESQRPLEDCLKIHAQRRNVAEALRLVQSPSSPPGRQTATQSEPVGLAFPETVTREAKYVVPLTNEALERLLVLLGRERRINELIWLVDTARGYDRSNLSALELSTRGYNSILACVKAFRKEPHVTRWFDQFNASMGDATVLREGEKELDFVGISGNGATFADLVNFGAIKPDAATYTILLKSYLDQFEGMGRKHETLDSELLDGIDATAKIALERNELKEDLVVRAILVNFYINHKQYNRALDIFDELYRATVAQNNSWNIMAWDEQDDYTLGLLWGSIVRGLIVAKEDTRLEQLLRAAPRDLKHNAVFYAQILEACIERSEPSVAFEFIKQVQQSRLEQVRIGVRTTESIPQAPADPTETSAAKHLHEILCTYVASPLPPTKLSRRTVPVVPAINSRTGSLMLSALRSMNNADMALALLTQLSHQNVRPTVGAIHQVIRMLQNDPHTAVEIYWSAVTKYDVRPDYSVFYELLRLLCRSPFAQTSEKAESFMIYWTRKVLSDMEVYDCPPDVHVYNIFLQRHSVRGMTKQCEKLLQLLMQKGLAPNIETYHHMMRAYGRALRSGYGVSKRVAFGALERTARSDTTRTKQRRGNDAKWNFLMSAIETSVAKSTGTVLQTSTREVSRRMPFLGFRLPEQVAPVHDLFVEMLGRGLEPNVETYRVLARVYDGLRMVAVEWEGWCRKRIRKLREAAARKFGESSVWEDPKWWPEEEGVEESVGGVGEDDDPVGRYLKRE